MKLRTIPLLILVFSILMACSKNDEPTLKKNPVSDPINSAPENFNLLSLDNGHVNSELMPTLSWEISADKENDEVSYTLFLDNNANPTTIIAKDITATEFQLVQSLDRDKTYYWNVVAKDSKNAETQSSQTYIFSTRGLIISQNALTQNAEFSKRSGHTITAFNGSLWLIGGSDGSRTLGDVWSSENGKNWVLKAEDAFGLYNKTGHTTVVFNDRLWAIGGGFSDVWSSVNGIDWVLETSTADFGSRENHSSVIYDNKIWVIGGTNISLESLNDVWSSVDGINWVQTTPNGQFSPMHDHTTVVFNNKMYLLGGSPSENSLVPGFYNDIYTSSSGIEWSRIDTTTEFKIPFAHTSVVYDGKIWVIGGLQVTVQNIFDEHQVKSLNNVWQSTDGLNWTNDFENIPFPERMNHTTTIFDNKIVVVGGMNQININTRELLNDIWLIE